MLSLFALLLCLQWVVAGDNAARLARQQNAAAISHTLSQLLAVPHAKFAMRDNGDGCDNGWHVCPNFPNECAPDGNYCCSATYNCPNDTTCFGANECCPQDAQTCSGNTCCDAGSTCCSGNNNCCDSGNFCCDDSFGGCCPNGTSCTPGENTCTPDGGEGGGSSPTTASLAPSSLNPLTIPTVAPMTIGGVSVGPFPPNSTSSTTPSSSPTLGGIPASSSSQNISVMSIRKTVSLAIVVGIIASGGSLL